MNSDFKDRAKRVEKGSEMVLERVNEIFKTRLEEIDSMIDQLSKTKNSTLTEIEKSKDCAELKTALGEIEKGISKKTEEQKKLKVAYDKFCADLKSVTAQKIEYCLWQKMSTYI